MTAEDDDDDDKYQRLVDIVCDTIFLNAYMEKLKRWHGILPHIDESDGIPQEKFSYASDEDERCARLADQANLDNIDGSLFRNPIKELDWSQIPKRLEEQWDALPKIIAKIEQQQTSSTKPDDDPSPIILSEYDLRILFYLRDRQIPSKQVHIAAAAKRDRKTTGEILKQLRELGFTHRPKGPRGGEVITEAGRQFIEGKEQPKQ